MAILTKRSYFGGCFASCFLSFSWDFFSLKEIRKLSNHSIIQNNHCEEMHRHLSLQAQVLSGAM
jgi:hypothetical protein